MGKKIKINESQLKQIVLEAAKRVINEINFNTFNYAYNRMDAIGQKERAEKLKNNFFDLRNRNLPSERIKFVDLGPETNTKFLYYSLILINDAGEECVTNISRDGKFIWTDKRGIHDRYPKTSDRRVANMFANAVKKWAEDIGYSHLAQKVDKNMFIA